MQRSDFAAKVPGRLTRALDNNWAFVPSDLPPSFEYSNDLILLLAEAHQSVGDLNGVGRTLSNPHLLIRPFMRKEAVLSSRIEGTQASLSQLVMFEATDNSYDANSSDVQEVSNYIKALDYGLEREKTLPISKRLLREMHQRLMAGVREQERTPGEFRTIQNWIGSPGSPIEKARYVPPPPKEMNACLDAFERYLHSRSTLPPLIRLASIHYQFEAIHPFIDGNGRIGRLLITLLLCLDNTMPSPLLYLSAFFESNRDEYYDRLLAVSRRNEWEEWFTYFLRGVIHQAKDAVTRADRLLALNERYREKFQSARSSALLLKLVDSLFETPAVTAKKVQEILAVSPRTAQQSIDKLVDAGILHEATGRSWKRLYVAREVIATVEDG
jgi:Fic family protein